MASNFTSASEDNTLLLLLPLPVLTEMDDDFLPPDNLDAAAIDADFSADASLVARIGEVESI